MLIVVLYLIATGLLVGAVWVAPTTGFMPVLAAVGAFHLAIGALIVRRLYGRDGR